MDGKKRRHENGKKRRHEKRDLAYLPTVPISSGQSRFGDRNPTSRPTTPKSRFVPIVPMNAQKHGFISAFCLFSLFFSRNSSLFGVLWPFFMYPSVAGSYPNKKSLYNIGIQVVHSPVIFFWAQETVYIFRPIFSCSKCVESLTKTLKNAYLKVSIFKIFRGSMPPDPPRKARASPSQFSLRNHCSLNHIPSQVSRLQLSKSWQVCSPSKSEWSENRLVGKWIDIRICESRIEGCSLNYVTLSSEVAEGNWAENDLIN